MSRSGIAGWSGVRQSHNEAGVSERLQVRSGMLIILFAFASPATFTTVEYRLPISSPFFAPGKRKAAGLADFGRF